MTIVKVSDLQNFQNIEKDLASNKRVVMIKNNRPIAIILSVKDYEKMEAIVRKSQDPGGFLEMLRTLQDS